jgi:hypothetical protein
MIDYGNEKLNEIFRDTWPNLGWAKRMNEFAGNYEGPLYARHPDLPEPGPYPDEMFEEAERREKLNAGFKQDADGNWYRPELKDLSRNERIELAEKEIAYIVMGGQDGREYASSIAFVLQVLDSLRDE